MNDKITTPGWEEENQLAKDYGWAPVPDPYRGDGWCKFSRGDEWVWSVYPKWIRAKTQDGKYTNHMHYTHLEAALNGEVIK